MSILIGIALNLFGQIALDSVDILIILILSICEHRIHFFVFSSISFIEVENMYIMLPVICRGGFIDSQTVCCCSLSQPGAQHKAGVLARLLCHSVVSNSGDPVDYSSPGFLCLLDFLGKNSGVGCHFLFQYLLPGTIYIF